MKMPTTIGNRLLASLSSQDAAPLWRHLQPIDLPVRRVLSEAGAPITSVYFLEQGFASVVAKTPSGAALEVGIIGREGMVGVPAILGQRRSPHECYVHIAGHGFAMSADHMWSEMAKRWSLADALLKFAYAFLVQVTHSALANGRFTIERRLARWLLMAHDRIEGDELALTHEFLAMMLGVRRAGVTDALHILEDKGAIRSSRQRVIILSRAELERIAGDCYGLPESELAHVGLVPEKKADSRSRASRSEGHQPS